MEVPHVRLISFDEITEIMGGPEELVIGVFLRMTGDIPGNMFFLMDIQSTKKLIHSLFDLSKMNATEEPISDEEGDFNELEMSAIAEIGNILAGSYLSSLSEFTHQRMIPSVPGVAFDMAGAIISSGLFELGEVGDYALVVDTMFMQDQSNISGHIFVLPDPKAVEKLFTALGVDCV